MRQVERLTMSTGEHAVLFVDLDGFKAINDRHGHEFGDRVLAGVADRLRRAARMDDVVARIGGDEFAVLLGRPFHHLDDTMVRRLASRILEMIEAPLEIDGTTVSISASVGADRLDDSSDLNAALRRADKAMYQAKRAGGGQFLDASFAH